MIWQGLSDGLGAELLVGEWEGSPHSAVQIPPQCRGIKWLGNDRCSAHIGLFHHFLSLYILESVLLFVCGSADRAAL